jgi:hypothetical protein
MSFWNITTDHLIWGIIFSILFCVLFDQSWFSNTACDVFPTMCW